MLLKLYLHTYHFVFLNTSALVFLGIITSYLIKYQCTVITATLHRNNTMLASVLSLLHKTEVILFPNKMILEDNRNSLVRNYQLNSLVKLKYTQRS